MKPVPVPSPITEPYWAGARAGRLMIQRCANCEAVTHPPGALCPVCWSGVLEWVEASGRGRVLSATVVHHPPSAAFASPRPYVLAIVRLEEGPQMMANILTEEPERVRIEMAVRLAFEQRGDFRIPQFVLADAKG